MFGALGEISVETVLTSIILILLKNDIIFSAEKTKSNLVHTLVRYKHLKQAFSPNH